MHLAYPPKFASPLLPISTGYNSPPMPREIKDNGYARFSRVNKCII